MLAEFLDKDSEENKQEHVNVDAMKWFVATNTENSTTEIFHVGTTKRPSKLNGRANHKN
jgi:hypothetical protein